MTHLLLGFLLKSRPYQKHDTQAVKAKAPNDIEREMSLSNISRATISQLSADEVDPPQWACFTDLL